jgi:hypothetical protein
MPMAGHALFVGWGQVVRGREQLALSVFQDTVAFYAKLQEDGRIDSFEPFLLSPHGGELAGFFIVRGDLTALDALRSSPDFLRVISRAGAIVDNLGVVTAYTAEALAQVLGLFGEVSQEVPQAT